MKSKISSFNIDDDYGMEVVRTFKRELKAEAVKWVKKDKIDCMNGTTTPYEILERWMKRLDITEKDLEESRGRTSRTAKPDALRGRIKELKKEIEDLEKERLKYDNRGIFNQDRDMIDKKLEPLTAKLQAFQEAQKIFREAEGGGE